MKKIAILSDTHGYWDDRLEKHLEGADEIWHAGDIGSEDVLKKLQAIAPVRSVWGNVDSHDFHKLMPEIQRFSIEGASVIIKHIGGYPGKYDPSVRDILLKERPSLFVSGHSHILKVMYDKRNGILHINPGAAGKQGWQKVRTIIRVTVHEGRFQDLEVVEMEMA